LQGIPLVPGLRRQALENTLPEPQVHHAAVVEQDANSNDVRLHTRPPNPPLLMGGVAEKVLRQAPFR
jgi:hypothetical protein